MKKLYEILKRAILIILVTSWSLLGVILLGYVCIPTGKYLYSYADEKIKQPLAEKIVQDFIKQYNSKDYDYIYNNLVDERYKKYSTKEEDKKEFADDYKKYGEIFMQEKGYLTSNDDYYYYYITVYQKTPKEKTTMDYTFKFSKKNKKFNIDSVSSKKHKDD